MIGFHSVDTWLLGFRVKIPQNVCNVRSKVSALVKWPPVCPLMTQNDTERHWQE